MSQESERPPPEIEAPAESAPESESESGAELGRQLQALMDRYFIAAVDLARELGVAPQTVVRWTRGELRPRREDLLALRRIFGDKGPDWEMLAQRP